MNAPSYQTHDPKGWCGDPKRGAAMGRHSHGVDLENYDGLLYVREIRLDSGGYDRNGTYFGGGRGTSPLYWICSPDLTIDRMTRAGNREDAKRIARGWYPKARFFR